MEPKNSLVRQYKTIFEMENVGLKSTETSLKAIAKEALNLGVGARGLRIILEELMLELMYEVPSSADRGVRHTKDGSRCGHAPVRLYKNHG